MALLRRSVRVAGSVLRVFPEYRVVRRRSDRLKQSVQRIAEFVEMADNDIFFGVLSCYAKLVRGARVFVPDVRLTALLGR